MISLLQRGAMFGLDARITLVVAVVIGLAVGINQVSRIKSNKIEATELQLGRIKAGYLLYYNDTNTLPYDGDLSHYDSNAQSYVDNHDLVDPWGNAFTYVHLSYCGQHEDFGTFTSKSSLIVSSGPDGIFNHPYSDYDGLGCDEVSDGLGNSVLIDQLVAGDDIAIKINTYDIDLQKAALAKQRLQEIKVKIDAIAAHNRMRWQRACNQAIKPYECTIDSNKDGQVVDGYEILSMNFYPRASETIVACGTSAELPPYDRWPYYAAHPSANATYVSGDETSMIAFLRALGLPAKYAVSPLGYNVILKYDSNDGDRCFAPFNYKIWYD